MFNLFKKQPTQTEITQTIEQIHNEFYTASDNILADAIAILEPNAFLLEKAQVLNRTGFTSSIEVVKAKEVEITKQQADIVKMYQFHFPNNKFITAEQVKQINKKYGLVCAPVSAYTGFVPMGKLENISKFKRDIRITGSLQRDKLIKAISCEYSSDEKVFNAEKKINSGMLFNVSEDFDRYSYSRHIVLESGEKINLKKWEQVDMSGLFICAPKKDINMDKMSEFGEVYAKSTKHEYIPDPVVLQPVKHGWLIVEAWGDEASDPLVVNETNN